MVHILEFMKENQQTIAEVQEGINKFMNARENPACKEIRKGLAEFLKVLYKAYLAQAGVLSKSHECKLLIL